MKRRFPMIQFDTEVGSFCMTCTFSLQTVGFCDFESERSMAFRKP